MITLNEKKEFIKWFLDSYTLSKKEAAWLITYISSKESLLEKVHFVRDIIGLPKAILISTECVSMTPFKFYKNNRVTPDVETAFLDIRSNPEEDIYIGLFFKERDTSPEYASVLEVNPMEKQKIIKGNLLELMAELTLDQAVREFNQKKLYEAIDSALLQGDKTKFLELTEKLNKIENDKL